MIKLRLLLCLSLALQAWISSTAMAGSLVRVRINTAHGLENALGAVADAGLKAADVIITPSSEFNGRPFIAPDKFIQDALSVQATIMSSSFSGWDYRFDTALYLNLSKNGLVHVYAYEPGGSQPPDVPPPAVFATVNLSGGRTGGGIEFAIPKGYMNGKGQSATPSGVTAQLAGLMASLKYNHPEWNWFDIKAALRMTASNFRTGYNPGRSGYGTINYRQADALRDADRFPLFPPAPLMRIRNNNRVAFAINSFKQSRRKGDALFRFRVRPTATCSELSLDELKAMGGQLLFSGDLSGTTNSLSLQLASSEQVYFVWLSRDANGTFSRMEPYSIFGPVKFASGVELEYGPRIGR